MAVTIMNDAPERSSTEALVTQFNLLIADVAAFVTKFNAHTHTENTNATYVQNATTAAIVAGQQAAAPVAQKITLLK